MLFRQPRVSLLTAAAVLTFGAVALADPPSETVEARLARGEAAYEAQRYSDALREYRSLYLDTNDLRALARQAQTEQAMGLWLDAWQHYETVLRAPNDPWVEARRPRIVAQQQEVDAHLARVSIESNVPSSWVIRDDVALGDAPRTVRMTPGAHAVRVGALEYESQVYRIEVHANETRTLHFVLRRVAPRVSSTTVETGSASTSREPPQPGQSLRWGTAREHAGYIDLLWPAGVLSLGVAGTVVGIVAWSLTIPTVAAFNADPRCGYNGGHIQGGEACRMNAERADNLRLMGNAMVLSGLLLTEIGLIWLGIGLSSNDEKVFRAPPGWRLSGGPGTLGLGLTHTF